MGPPWEDAQRLAMATRFRPVRGAHPPGHIPVLCGQRHRHSLGNFRGHPVGAVVAASIWSGGVSAVLLVYSVRHIASKIHKRMNTKVIRPSPNNQQARKRWEFQGELRNSSKGIWTTSGRGNRWEFYGELRNSSKGSRTTSGWGNRWEFHGELRNSIKGSEGVTERQLGLALFRIGDHRRR